MYTMVCELPNTCLAICEFQVAEQLLLVSQERLGQSFLEEISEVEGASGEGRILGAFGPESSYFVSISGEFTFDIL